MYPKSKKLELIKMAGKKIKEQRLISIGSILIAMGILFLLCCMIMISNANEQPWPRERYVFMWASTFPMLSILLLFFGVVILGEGLVESSILKPHALPIGVAILFMGPIVVIIFINWIYKVFGVAFHFEQIIVILIGFYLISIGAAFLLNRIYYYLKDQDFNRDHQKYKCMRCGFKTKRLAFKPIECPRCGGAVMKST